MQIDIKKLENLKRIMTVTLPSDQIEQEFSTRLKKQAQQAKIKGFRAGKVPAQMVEQYYGASIRQEILDELVRSSFYEALEKEKIQIAGMPKIEFKSILAGAPFEYEATFEVYPEITLNNLQGAKIEKLETQIKEEDITKVLEKLREQNANWVEVDRTAKEGDLINLDFEGSIDGEKFAQGQASHFEVVIGSHKMIPGFEEGLVGKKAGESFDLSLSFPEDYHHKDFAGKAVVFAIKMNAVKEKKLPELNDAFADILEVEGGLEGLKKEVRQNMERELVRAQKINLKRQVIDELTKRNPVEVPETLINIEIDNMEKEFLHRLGMNSKKQFPGFSEETKQIFHDRARQRVLVGLLFSEFLKSQQIKLDQEIVMQQLKDMSEAYDNPEEMIRNFSQDRRFVEHVESLALEEQVVQKLVETAEIVPQESSYEEILKKATEASNLL